MDKIREICRTYASTSFIVAGLLALIMYGAIFMMVLAMTLG